MKITDYIVKFLYFLCIVAITGLTLIVFIQVFSRFIKFSLPGTEELARLLVVWLTFLGSSLAIHEKMHLAVNFFVGLTSEKNQKRIYVFVHLLIMIFFGVLTIYGFSLTLSALTTTSSTLQLPMAIFYGAIPVSSVFSIYFIFLNMLKPSTKGGESSI